jgi:hypothetical protein
MHNENNISQAIEECRAGNHVAHVENQNPKSRGAGRVVAIRPCGPGHLTLNFSDPRRDHRAGDQDTIERVTARQAARLIDTFLRGRLVHIDDVFDLWINQAERECYILGETHTPTKVRIEYEMPRAGTVGSWCYATRLGNDYYLTVT